MLDWKTTKRVCPSCGKELKYTTYAGYKIANEKNSLCRSCNRIGEKNPFYGKKHSEITKKEISRNVSLVQVGIPLSDSHKLSISNSLKGRILSDAWKEKISKTRIRLGIKSVMKGKTHSNETKRKLRLITIEQLKKIYPNVRPMYNPNACKLIDEYGNKNGYTFQHAENGGEFYIKKLGYWVDGYDKEKNAVIEVDEKKHFDRNGNLKLKDVTRQKEIQLHLNCEFIRIKI